MKLLKLFGIFLLFLSILGCQPNQEKKTFVKYESSSEAKPNILWISCEDISPRLGCYGDSIAQTPNIDKLAAEGVKYTNMYTVAPVCAPNRSAVITGMYPTSIGTHHMRTSHKNEKGSLPSPYSSVPKHYVKAFPEYLRAAGYYCTNNSKTDYQFSGFTEVPVTIWDEQGRRAHFKNRPDKDQPFFAVFNYTMTHESQTWQEPEYTDPSTVKLPPYYPDTKPVRKSIARLYDRIAKLDSVVGMHLKELEDLGIADNTVVFFWSDHGDGLPRGKRWLYDSGTLVPFIIKWPGVIDAGTIIDDLRSSIDWGPTVLSIAQIASPYHMQGKPFLGQYAQAPGDYVFASRDRFDESYDMIRSVRDEKWRYVRNYYPNTPYVVWVPYRNRSPIMKEMLKLHAADSLNEVQKLWFRNTRPPEELYDCDADPHQINNLINDPNYKNELIRLRNTLDNWRVKSQDMGDISEYQMKEMNWPGEEVPVTEVPHFLPNTENNRNSKLMDEGGDLTYPATLSLYCPTQGASIAYTFDEGDEPRWLLYTGPIKLEKGSITIKAKAIRYGFNHSEEVVATFKIN
jgi:arylsulfatase A-like enzyme